MNFTDKMSGFYVILKNLLEFYGLRSFFPFSGKDVQAGNGNGAAKMDEQGWVYNATGGEGDWETVLDMNDQPMAHRGLNASNHPFCWYEFMPSVRDYYRGLTLENSLILFTLGCLAGILIILLFIDTLCYLLKYSSSSTKSHSIFVISIYPVAAVATLCALFVPRAQLVSEAVIQVVFMSCLYQLFCLYMAYCDGVTGVMHKASSKTIDLRVGPCCCWPCCICLPSVKLTKERVSFLRLLVLQLPIVQGLCYLVQLIMWAEKQTIYHAHNSYIQPIVVTSILMGVWGIVMTTKMMVGILKHHYLIGKYVVLQLVLVLTKFQGLFAKIAVWGGVFSCSYPMTPTLYANLIYNSILLWEMVVLMFLARMFYKQPIPESYSTVKPSNLPQKISTITEKVTKPEFYLDNNNISMDKS